LSIWGAAPSQVENVVTILNKMPAWTEANPKRAQILSRLQQLDALPTATLRAALSEFVKRHRDANTYSIAEMSKGFLMTRFIFKTPEAETENVRFYGGWDGVPFVNGVANPMWPLGFEESGAIGIVGKYQSYSGPPYSIVEEFDDFLKRYGRRRIVSG
jgi:hypothetical protein